MVNMQYNVMQRHVLDGEEMGKQILTGLQWPVLSR